MLDDLRPWLERSDQNRLNQIEDGDGGTNSLTTHFAELLDHWDDSRIKMFLTSCGLSFRSKWPDVLIRGDYEPLNATGVGAARLVGFARQSDVGALLAIVPRLTSRFVPADRFLPIGPGIWGNTCIVVPHQLDGRAFRHLFTGERFSSTGALLPAADIFATSPVAMLWSPRS
jgi:(1->4)-alpha-D-glucan 1-alpha-D-glucosylmutase